MGGVMAVPWLSAAGDLVMDDQLARAVLREVARLQTDLGNRKDAVAAFKSTYADGATLLSDACRWFGTRNDGRPRVRSTPKEAEQGRARVDVSAFVKDLVSEFGYMPNDKILAFVFAWLGRPTGSGPGNFATGRSAMRPLGWVFERTDDRRGWVARHDPEYGERVARQRALLAELGQVRAERAAHAEELAKAEQREAELKRLLDDAGGA